MVRMCRNLGTQSPTDGHLDFFNFAITNNAGVKILTELCILEYFRMIDS